MNAPKDKLHVLERLNELEVEQARVQYTALEVAAEEHRNRVAEVKAGIAQTRDFEQHLLVRSDAVSVESLRHVQSYLYCRAQDLREHQSALAQAEILADNARAALMRRYERLVAIQRLHERRARAAAVERSRAEQKQLDDRAIVAKVSRSKE